MDKESTFRIVDGDVEIVLDVDQVEYLYDVLTDWLNADMRLSGYNLKEGRIQEIVVE